jgi:hypothetical protein
VPYSFEEENTPLAPVKYRKYAIEFIVIGITTVFQTIARKKPQHD